MSSHSLIPIPQPGDTKWWASSIVRRAAPNFTLLATFTLKRAVTFTIGYRPSPLRRHVSSTPMTWAAPPYSSGGRPCRVAPSPQPWLLSAGLLSGGPEVHAAIASLLLRHGDRIPRTIPVIREQTYQLSPTFLFLCCGASPGWPRLGALLLFRP
jgi:hypothetical protein